MKNVKFKIFFIGALLSLSAALTGCTEAENPVLENSTTPAPTETAEATERETDTEESSETVPTRKETEIMITAEQNETSAESETAAETSAETYPVSAEAPGSVPDSYREDGENGLKVIGRNGHYTGLMGCWGTMENCDKYTAAVNRAKEALPNVNVYSMVIPTSSDFYTPEDVTGFTESQKKKIDHITEGLSGVTNADAYSALAAHLEEPIFSRTDFHWFPLGAYYASEAFAKSAGAENDFAALSLYKPVERGGYLGATAKYANSDNLNSDPETFTLYISPNDERLKTRYYDVSFQNGYDGDLFVTRDASAYYCSFLGADNLIAEIETDVKNGRTLVIFKDSYGNAIVPFLTTCFEKIYVCDPRYIEVNAKEFCENVGATDILFATCTFTPAGPNCSYVQSLF